MNKKYFEELNIFELSIIDIKMFKIIKFQDKNGKIFSRANQVGYKLNFYNQFELNWAY